MRRSSYTQTRNSFRMDIHTQARTTQLYTVSSSDLVKSACCWDFRVGDLRGKRSPN